MVYTAPGSAAFSKKRGSMADKITAELTLVDAELEAISLGTIGLNSGEILVGNAGNAAAAVTPSGDVTVSNAGVTTIGAKKVTAAMIACADGKILIGGADGAAAAQTPSGAVTMTNAGVFSLADSALSPAKLALTDAHIIVGDASGEGADVAMSGDATIANTGAVTIGAKKVTAAKTAIADGKIFIGGADGAAAEQTLSGDVTVSNAGVTAIGAKKCTASQIALAEGKVFIGAVGGAAAAQSLAGDVTVAVDGTTTVGAKKIGKAMMVSEAADVAGNIFVSTGVTSAIDEVAVSGDATLAANGALTIADSVLDGSNVTNVANINVVGGIPVIFRIDVADSTGNTDVTSTHKIKVIDFWFQNTGAAAHATLDTIQLKNGTTAITGAIAKTATQYAIKRADIIDPAGQTISAGGTIRIAAVKDTNVAVTAYVMAVRSA